MNDGSGEENSIITMPIDPNIIQFTLKKTFKSSVEDGLESNFLVGRDKEANRLKAVLTNRKASTTLVSGLRGVGKTSFVRAVLNKITKENNKTLPIYISFAELKESQNESSSLRDVVLKTLVRALFVKINTNDQIKTSVGIQELYDQVNYSSISEENRIDLIKTNSKGESQDKTVKYTHTYELSKDVKALIFLVFFAPFLMWIFQYNVPTVAKLISLAVVAIPVIYIVVFKNLVQENAITKFTEESNSTQNHSNTSRNKILDNTFETLELKFQNVLHDLAKMGHKVVFVLDELDKLEEKTTNLKESKIIELIKPLKNLFTLSEASFIFISDETFFDKLTEQNTSEPYTSSYTIFTDKIFLPLHSTTDTQIIIKSAIEKVSLGESKLDQFISYLCYISKNHMFSVYETLENFVTYSPSGEITALVKTEYHERGNIKDDWEIEAGNAVFIDATCRFYNKPNDPRYNQKLYELLHQVANNLIAPTYKVTATESDWLSSGDYTSTEKDKDFILDANGAVEFMLKSMERLGFCKVKTSMMDVGGRQIEHYEYEIDRLIYPDINTVTNLQEKLSFEVKFVESFNRLKAEVERVEASIFAEVAKGHKNEFSDLKKIHDRIQEGNKYKLGKSEIDDAQADLEVLESKISEEVDAKIPEQIRTDLGLSKTPLTRSPNGNPWYSFDPKLKDFYTALDSYNNSGNLVIMTKPSHSRGIIFVFGAEKDLFEVFESINQTERKEARNRVISINPSEGIKSTAYWSNFTVDYRSLDSDFKKIKLKCESYLDETPIS